MDQLEGTVWKYGDNINTDIISPPAYMELSTAQAAPYAMSPIDSDFGRLVRPGDIFVAGQNLGSGSSRETAPLTLKELGIIAVVAKSFARIFYRNTINVGLLAVECPDTDRIEKGDRVRIDLEQSCILNLTRGETYRIDPIPPHITDLIECGGLIPYLRQLRQKQP